jgi:hypothetical protein
MSESQKRSPRRNEIEFNNRSDAMNDVKPPEPALQMKVYPFFSIAGWVLILISFVIGLFVLAPTAVGYWGESAKAVRDAADVGSTLLSDLGSLTVTPRWLEPLTFLGVASFMVGIALQFSTIPHVLKNRGSVMSACFPLIARYGK